VTTVVNYPNRSRTIFRPDEPSVATRKVIMAIQDDIIAMLSQVSDAGDRATDRGRTGAEMYSQIADLLSGDNRSKAMREIAMLSGNPEMSIEEQMRYDPLTGSRVADIIEKYMDEVSEPLPDTAAAMPRPRPDMSVLPSPDASPRTSVSAEEPPRPDFDPDTAERLILEQDEGLAGLMAGVSPKYGINTPTPIQVEDEYAGTPGTSVGMNPVSNGRIPLKERLFAGQEAAGGPMSGTEQLMYASAFIPAAAIPQIGRILGMGASQIRNFLRAGDKGSEAMGKILQQRAKSLSPDELAEVQLLLPKPTAGAPSSYVAPSAQVGAQGRQAAQAAARARQAAEARARAAARGERSGQPIRIEQTPAQRLGSTQGSGSAFDDLINRLGPIGMAEGMSVRDKIMNTYGRM
jgi:hypothetical protein